MNAILLSINGPWDFPDTEKYFDLEDPKYQGFTGKTRRTVWDSDKKSFLITALDLDRNQIIVVEDRTGNGGAHPSRLWTKIVKDNISMGIDQVEFTDLVATPLSRQLVGASHLTTYQYGEKASVQKIPTSPFLVSKDPFLNLKLSINKEPIFAEDFLRLNANQVIPGMVVGMVTEITKSNSGLFAIRVKILQNKTMNQVTETDITCWHTDVAFTNLRAIVENAKDTQKPLGFNNVKMDKDAHKSDLISKLSTTQNTFAMFVNANPYVAALKSFCSVTLEMSQSSNTITPSNDDPSSEILPDGTYSGIVEVSVPLYVFRTTPLAYKESNDTILQELTFVLTLSTDNQQHYITLQDYEVANDMFADETNNLLTMCATEEGRDRIVMKMESPIEGSFEISASSIVGYRRKE